MTVTLKYFPSKSNRLIQTITHVQSGLKNKAKLFMQNKRPLTGNGFWTCVSECVLVRETKENKWLLDENMIQS